MSERARKWLIIFNIIVGIIVSVQAIRFDPRLLKPVASLIYNVSDWIEKATGIRKNVEEEINKKKHQEKKNETQGTQGDREQP